MLNDIRAIIFDLDGTLVDSMWIWKQIDIDFLGKRNIDFPEDLQKEIEGMSFTETATYFINRFKLEEPLEVIQKEWNEMAKTFYGSQIKLKDQVMPLIEFASQNDIKLGIGTSNSRELLYEVIEAHGIKHYFDSMRTSCEVDKGKPSPDIFLKVAEDLDIHPSQCLVFEDTHAGVIAAKRAGMRVIAVYDELSEPYIDDIKRDADMFIYSFKELK
ncbi:MAG TPA: HAD family hydrolase [Clostridiales bacterium UBA8960]|nr:HAD family hydrolase [Clostridiales bacterium UBA8960]